MSTTVEIRDADRSGNLVVSLMDILSVIEPFGRDLVWAVLELYATGDAVRVGQPIPDLEEAINQAPLVLEWDALKRLAEALDQVIDIAIVGAVDVSRIPRLRLNADLSIGAEFVLQGIDSSVWRVYAQNDEILHRLSSRFNDIAVIRT